MRRDQPTSISVLRSGVCKEQETGHSLDRENCT
jgi:hypothetical protein